MSVLLESGLQLLQLLQLQQPPTPEASLWSTTSWPSGLLTFSHKCEITGWEICKGLSSGPNLPSTLAKGQTPGCGLSLRNPPQHSHPTTLETWVKTNRKHPPDPDGDKERQGPRAVQRLQRKKILPRLIRSTRTAY